MDSEFFLSPEEEKAIYDHHENGPEHLGYVRFLERVAAPVAKKLSPGAMGLDFGSGPGPTMDTIFQSYGFSQENYDIFYCNQASKLERAYDFITCTEVVEHVHSPRKIFLQLTSLLKPGAVLGISTQLLSDGQNFKDWWYRRDPTHVCFYGKKTFDWIGHWRGWKVEYPIDGIIVFTASK